VDQDSEPEGLDPQKLMARASYLAVPHKKNLHLCISVFFFLDFCINVPNTCMAGKDKYCVFFNVLKFE